MSGSPANESASAISERSQDVKKLLVLGAGACGAAAIALTLVGAGVATADDQVVGQTYKDAKAAIGQMGLTPVVATTVGDRKDWDDCIVTSANKAPFLDESGNKTGNQMLVNLNCYAKYSTGNWPGFSVAEPGGPQDVRGRPRGKAAAGGRSGGGAAAGRSRTQLAAVDAPQAGE